MPTFAPTNGNTILPEIDAIHRHTPILQTLPVWGVIRRYLFTPVSEVLTAKEIRAAFPAVRQHIMAQAQAICATDGSMARR